MDNYRKLSQFNQEAEAQDTDLVVTLRPNGSGGFENVNVPVGGILANVTAPVTSVNGKTGDAVLNAADIGLGNVVNLAPEDYPITDATKSYVDTNTLIVVKHGATASTARPADASTVMWIGSVEPINSIDNDIWINTA